MSEYSEADLDEAFDHVNRHVDAYETEAERSAYVDALIAYDMRLRHGQCPAWFALLEIDSDE